MLHCTANYVYGILADSVQRGKTIHSHFKVRATQVQEQRGHSVWKNDTWQQSEILVLVLAARAAADDGGVAVRHDGRGVRVVRRGRGGGRGGRVGGRGLDGGGGGGCSHVPP